jgi:hypothetical protein
MNKRTFFTAILFAATTLSASATGLLHDLSYKVRLGYNLGGTAPVGMPATIRGLNKYTPKAAFTIGVDAFRELNGPWGMMVGFHLEKKAMETDARVKSYSMEMKKDGEPLKGVFTGNVVTNVSLNMLTIPVQATYDVGKKVRLKFGPYISYVSAADFKGYAYDGYLREDNPVGQKVEVGHDAGERGDYDFSEDLRKWQLGLDLGADWYFSNRLGAYAGLTWGITGIFKSSFSTIEQTMYPIFGTIGITYNLK